MAVTRQVSSLTYTVRIRVVLKYLGQLCLAVAIINLIPLGVALLLHEYVLAQRLGVVITSLGVIAVLFSRWPASGPVQANEALIITALIFVLISLAMIYPIMGQDVSFIDALFEAVSAITTTGLSTLPSVGDKSDAFLFTRAWMQWYGGLGIVVLSLALLLEPGAAAQRLGRVAMEWRDLLTGTKLHARRVTQVYLILTTTAVIALWLAGLDGFSALLHALAGISTGGFSPYEDSIAGFSSWIGQAVLMSFSFAGAISLALYHPAYYRHWSEHTGYLELRALIGAVLISALALTLTMSFVAQTPWSDTIRNAPLVAVSAQTGAGFTSMAVGPIDPASKLVLIGSMIIGGGIGSTAGGIKILRLLIFIRMLQLVIQRACMPSHAVLRPRLGGHRLDNAEIEHALLVILLFVVVILLSWLPFLALGYPPLDALFDVVSATATVGLSTGVTSMELPAVLKIVLCLDMLLGRLEVVALLMVLYPGAWVGKRRT